MLQQEIDLGLCMDPDGQVCELKDMALTMSPLTPGLLASYSSRCAQVVAVSTQGTMYICEIECM